MNRSSPDHQSLMKYLSRARRVSKAGATRERETVQEDESTITAMEHMKRARERMTSSSVGMIENFFETTAHESAVKNAFRRFQEAQVGDSVYEQMDQYAPEVDIVSLLFHEHDERHRAASTIQIAFRYFMMRRGKMTRALLKEPSKARYMETREEREARRKLVADLRARQEVILSDKTKSEREKLQHLLNHQLLIASYKTRLMEERQRLEQEAEEAKR